MSFMPGDQVWVENKDKKPIELGWNSRYTVIQPGEKQLVVVEAAINAWGDPRSGPEITKFKIGEEVHFIPPREEEVSRLQTRYGAEGLEPGKHLRVDEAPPGAPKAVVTTVSGEKLTMVTDDPTGQHQSQTEAPMNVEAQIAQLQSQLASMQQMHAERVQREETDELAEDVPQPVHPGTPGSGPPITPEAIPVLDSDEA